MHKLILGIGCNEADTLFPAILKKAFWDIPQLAINRIFKVCK
jgi:hypothetical protein